MVDLKSELATLTISDEQRKTLEQNPRRGLAAIHEARKRGASDIARYATAVFNNSNWSPKHEAPSTNRSVVVDCQLCGGDRVVLVNDYDPAKLYAEVYKRCPSCNARSSS